MFNGNNPGKWYAFFVVTGQEDNVKVRLQYRFRDRKAVFFVPKRRIRERKKGRWEDNIRTLFPGYILLNGEVGMDEYIRFEGVPGLIRPLRDKTGLLQIQNSEIELISRLICNTEIIGSSSIFIGGSRIVVVDGPLVGLEGHIESVDSRKGRAKVRMNFAGESRLVELSVNVVQAVHKKNELLDSFAAI